MKREGEQFCPKEGKGREHVKVNTETVEKLKEFYEVWNQRLYELVGKDLGWKNTLVQ